MSVPNTSSNRVLKSVTLRDGDKFVVPNGGRIVSIIVDGMISLSTNGCALPEPSNYVCRAFKIASNDDADDRHPFGVWKIEGFVIEDIFYETDFPQIIISTNPAPDISGNINNRIPSSNNMLPAIIRVLNISRTFNGDKRDEYELKVKIAEGFEDKIKMRLSSQGFADKIFLTSYPTTC